MTRTPLMLRKTAADRAMEREDRRFKKAKDRHGKARFTYLKARCGGRA